MESSARLRHYRGSAQKIRLVADLVRRKPLVQALATLRTTRKGCSADLLKLVESAAANAANKEAGFDTDSLVVSKIHVDEAGRKPLQRNAMIRSVSNYKKRFARPRFMSGPQGRMWLVPRPFCHVTVFLSDDPTARKAAGLPGEAPKALARKGRTSRVGAAAAKLGARPKGEKGDEKTAKSGKTAKPARVAKPGTAKQPAAKIPASE